MRAWRSWITLLEGQEWLEVTTSWPGAFERHSRRAGIRREALPDGWEGLEDPSEWLGGVGRPIRMVGGLKALPKGPGGVGSPSWWPRGVTSGWNALLEVVERDGRGWECLPEGQE